MERCPKCKNEINLIVKFGKRFYLCCDHEYTEEFIKAINTTCLLKLLNLLPPA